MSMPDYATRSSMNGGYCTPAEAAAAVANPDAYILDVRNDGEIAADGAVTDVPHYVHSSCTPSAAPELEAQAETMFPNKEATILVYCRSGARANKARQVLIAKGYTNVINGGGFVDVKAALNK